MSKIFLIGMPGSGKSTIGKSLATQLNYTFLDIDTEIERKEGATVEAIFELKGESYFRQVEAQVLGQVAEKKGDFVIATGGGTPCHYNGLALMQKVGKTVFINISPKVLINRLKADTQRPLLKDGVENKIQKLYFDRIDVYSNAEIKIEGDSVTVDKLVATIVDKL
ncbi:MAG: shikimate kinase [Cyclobacteriaceae bacterium]|nr:shikimate kinase [Cyclobacteriaceae bacterium]